MTDFKIKPGIATIANGDSGWIIMDETGRKMITSALASELIGLIRRDLGDEDGLVAALADHFPAEQVYYALIQLENLGVIFKGEVQPESPVDFFRIKVHGQKRTEYPCPPMSATAVRIVSIDGSDANALTALLDRSQLLRIEHVPDWQVQKMTADAVYVVVTPDYLEPELEAFGRLAYERRIRWLPVKPRGVIPWIGPLFLPAETGCVECLLDRVRGHRRLEVEQILKNGGKQSLRLSVAKTVHSIEMVAGLLAVELEKLAAGGASELVGAVFTLDFRTLRLERHPLTKREQCPVCGTILHTNTRTIALPKEPLRLQSREKADYCDGGERVCSAVETLEKYAHLISPITGVVGQLTPLEGIPACFVQVIKSDWNVRGSGEKALSGQNARLPGAGFSTGKGRTVPQARASALGEAIERYCSQYEGYEPHFRAPFVELDNVAIHPHDLMGFSERQYTEREAWRQKGVTAYVPDPYDAVRPIDWSPAWSLSQDRWRLIPSAFAYFCYPRERGGDICRGCSNGVAAGNCLEEAIMQGFFELVERDAMAMWWYHKLRKPSVDWRGFDSSFVAAADAAINELGMRLEILDLTTDLGIPVFSANLFNQNENLCFKSNGLGCHHDPRIALERAVSELGQTWTLPDMDAYSLKFQDIPLSRELFLQADPHKTPKTASDFVRERRGDFLDDIEDVVRLLRTRGLEMLAMDLTRPDVGFPVARVIVPGLVHFWPRFGCRRLFEVPKAAGWIEGGAGEEGLNPVPFHC
jgi:bacteriocin biosynthesis cyclodehydratase domain-containing protein